MIPEAGKCLAAPTYDTILFDLDGTLLDIEMDHFIATYLDQLGSKFSDLVPLQRFRQVVGEAIYRLLYDNRGSYSNERQFLATLERCLGLTPERFHQGLRSWLAVDCPRLRPLARPVPLAPSLLQAAFAGGRRVVIATNPVFPRPVVDARLAWGGLSDYPYCLVTSYENSRYCKPHPGFFLDLLERLEITADRCLMVGNDTEHDLAAAQVGMATFLVDTWLVDRAEGDYAYDFRGSHEALLEVLRRTAPSA